MSHRIILAASIGFLTLAMCQSQKTKEISEDNTTISPKEEVVVAPATPSTPATKPTKTGEPEMSVGLPPDKAAVKTAQEEQNKATPNKSGIIYLKEGENRFLKDYQMNITFKQMTEDSRCPKDVECIWAGVATAEVEVMGLATRPVILKLSTMQNTGRGYYKTQEFNGYAISLVEVTPGTTSDKGFKALKGSYRIGIKLEKGTALDPKTQRGGTTTK